MFLKSIVGLFLEFFKVAQEFVDAFNILVNFFEVCPVRSWRVHADAFKSGDFWGFGLQTGGVLLFFAGKDEDCNKCKEEKECSECSCGRAFLF